MEINTEYNWRSGKEIQFTPHKISRMKCIRCPECGEPILMVPTLNKMVEAIENHISMHRKMLNVDNSETRLNMPSIRTGLTEQVLNRAADTNEPQFKTPIWL